MEKNKKLNILWKKFESTGKIEHYLSYKNLEKQKEETNGKPNNNKSNSFESDALSR